MLEAGFDTVTPNSRLTISSWAYDRAADTPGIDIFDNRAMETACYHPGYTFVEKLQTIATKFRQEQESDKIYPNLMRQYYDISCLLEHQQVLSFIGTDAYQAHKEARFRGKEKNFNLQAAEALLLNDQALRARFTDRYAATSALYYKGQPDFETVLAKIHAHMDRF